MKAMIFAAGYGTRLAPLTNTKPKAMVEIAGKPMLQMQIEKLRNNGFSYIVVNVHHFSEQIIHFLNSHDFGVEIHISDETQELLNTGGGLKNAKNFFDEGDNFLVHNVDIYSNIDLKDMYNYHLNSTNLATMAVKHRDSTNYLLFDETDRLYGWKSYKTNLEIIAIRKSFCNEMAFSGIYVFNYKIFDLMKKNGSYSIIPELLNVAETERIGAYIHDDKDILDLGKPSAIKECEAIMKKERSAGQY
jgi:NDP-sugar pyrophosphorylase family protein